MGYVMVMGSLERFGQLSAGTVNFNAIRVGAGGSSRDELMAVLGLISDDAALFVGFKYASALSMNEVLSCSDHAHDVALRPEDDWSVTRLKYLHHVMREKARVISEEGQWRPRNAEKVAVMAECALAESIGVGVCSRCRGTGQASKGGLLVACGGCSGSGARKISNRGYAQMVDIDEKAWRDRWHWRYDALMNVCIEWEQEAVRALKREKHSVNS